MELSFKEELNGIFDETELLTICEFARRAMADAETFDEILEEMDVPDEIGIDIRERLQKFMDS